VSARLYYTNASNEFDSILLGARPTRIFGRQGDPLRLADGEVPPAAQCRVFQKDGAWHIENLGASEQTLVNSQPVALARLQDGAEIRCGVLMLRFEELSLPDRLLQQSQEIALLREALGQSEATRTAASSELMAAQTDVQRLDAECEKLRRELAEQHQSHEALRAELEGLRRERDTYRAALLTQIQDLIRKVERAEAEADFRIQERDLLAARLATAEARASEFELAIRQTVANRDALERRLESQAADLGNLLQSNKELVEERKHLLMLRESAVRSMEEAVAAYKNAQKELLELHDRLGETRRRPPEA
jgi:chromosome segregation ATPase